MPVTSLAAADANVGAKVQMECVLHGIDFEDIDTEPGQKPTHFDLYGDSIKHQWIAAKSGAIIVGYLDWVRR